MEYSDGMGHVKYSVNFVVAKELNFWQLKALTRQLRLHEMVPLAQTYDSVYKKKIFVGCVNLFDGNKIYNLNKPQDKKIKLGVKTIELRQGSQTK